MDLSQPEYFLECDVVSIPLPIIDEISNHPLKISIGLSCTCFPTCLFLLPVWFRCTMPPLSPTYHLNLPKLQLDPPKLCAALKSLFQVPQNQWADARPRSLPALLPTRSSTGSLALTRPPVRSITIRRVDVNQSGRRNKRSFPQVYALQSS